MAENETTVASAKPRLRALGRGLESLLPATPSQQAAPPANAAQPEGPPAPVREIAIALIDENPQQTRRTVDPAGLEELKHSIAQRGLMQPVIVRPVAGGRFQLMGGQRRLMAASQLGHSEILAHVVQANDSQAFEITIIENLQRENLNPMEQAQAFGRLASDFGYHHDEIAAKTGKHRSSVTNYLRLLRLPAELQHALADNRITMGHAKALLSLEDPESMAAVGLRVITQELSVRKTEEAVQHLLHGRPKKPAKPAPAVDPNVREAQEQLQRALGMRVQVEDRNGRGKVVIEYASLDDFETLMTALAKQPSAG